MIPQELKDYVAQERAAGHVDEDIRLALNSAGWELEVINEALKTDAVLIPPRKFELPKKGQILSRKWAIGLCIAVGALALIGGGTWAYLGYFSPDPHTVLSRMVTETQEISSFAFVSSIDLYGPEPDLNATTTDAISVFGGTVPTGPLHLDIDIEGMLDAHDEAQPSYSGKLALVIENSGIFDLSTSLDTVFTENNFFLRLTKAPIILGMNLSGMEEQWIEIDGKEAKDRAEDQGVKTELSDEQRDRIHELITEFSYIENITEEGEEKISGVTAYHYLITLNLSELKRVLHEIELVVKPDTPPLSENTYSPLGENALEPIHLWVGKKDYLPYKIVLKQKTSREGEELYSLNSESVMSRYNEKFDIKAPANARPFSEVFEEFMNSQEKTQGPLLERGDMFRQVVDKFVLVPASSVSDIMKPSVFASSQSGLLGGAISLFGLFE